MREALAGAAGSGSASAVPGRWEAPPPEEMDALLPGYEVTRLLGRGGMGAVYKGLQTNLERPVAIKILPPEMAAADPSFEERFRREAKAMAKLDHSNIVTVYDFGRTAAGHSYFVMEFVDGMDFHQLIRSGHLDLQGAINAVSQVCDALEYAHGMGFVHRDIKPANIFINQAGILKVGDFGLAKMVGSGEGEALLTQTGIAMGTPIYSAPEQLTGGDVDRRADIYSLGVMFYEMLTGQLPHGRFPAPSQKVPVDTRLDDVVFRAMDVEPEHRYSTAYEMRTDVEAAYTGSAVGEAEAEGEPAAAAGSGEAISAAVAEEGEKKESPPSQRGPRRRSPKQDGSKTSLMVAAAIGVLIAVGVGAFFLSGLDERKEEMQAYVEERTEAERGGAGDETTGADDKSPFPLPLPEFPPKRPDVRCKLVVLPITDDSSVSLPPWCDEMLESRPADFVDFELEPGVIVALRANGDLSIWGKPEFFEQSGIGPGLRGVNAVAAHGWWGHLAYLTREGKIVGIGKSLGTEEQPVHLFADEEPVVQIGTSRRLIGLTAQGKLLSWTPPVFDSELQPADYDRHLSAGVHSFRMSDRLSVVTRDGRWYLFLKDNPPEIWPGKERIVQQIGSHLCVTEDGTFADWFRDEFRSKPTAILEGLTPNEVEWSASNDYGGWRAVRTVDGRYRIHVKNRSGNRPYEPLDERFSIATQGAVKIDLFRPHNDFEILRPYFLFALLPADSVSRSGYWEVEDLIADRERLRESKESSQQIDSAPTGDQADSPFPLPIPDFPPRRPEGKGRLVSIALKPDSRPLPPWFGRVESEDHPNLVRITASRSKPDWASIVGLTDEGRVIAFDGKRRRDLQAYNGEAVALSHRTAHGNLQILESNGNVFSVIGSAEHPPQVIEDAALLGPTGAISAVVRRNGKLLAWGGAPERKPERYGTIAGAKHAMDWAHGKEISAISFEDSKQLYLATDGSAYWEWTSGNSTGGTAFPPRSFVKLSEDGTFGVTPSGRLVKGHRGIVELPHLDFRDARVFRWNKIHLSIHGAGRVIAYSDAPAGVQEPSWEKAFEGALDFEFFFDHLLVLLPSDSVSRSGYWEVEDLIADREKLRKE